MTRSMMMPLVSSLFAVAFFAFNEPPTKNVTASVEQMPRHASVWAELSAASEVSKEDGTLEQVLTKLAERHTVDIRLDHKELKDIEVNPANVRPDVDIRGKSLATTLTQLLRAWGLGFAVTPDGILVTSTEEAESSTSVRVYEMPEGVDADALMTALEVLLLFDEASVDVRMERLGTRLLVRQTTSMHLEIQALLAELKIEVDSAAAERPRNAEEGVTAKTYFVRFGDARQVAEALEACVAPSSWQRSGGEGSIVVVEATIPNEDIVDSAVTNEGKETAANATNLRQKPQNKEATTKSALVVAQTSAIHRRVKKTLNDLENSFSDDYGFVGSAGGF